MNIYNTKTSGCLLLIALLLGVSAHAAPIPAVSISADEGLMWPDADTNGWRFQALANIDVVSLGAWDYLGDGLPSAVDVGLWADDGTLLASLTLGAGTSAVLVGGFRYADLAAAIALTSGEFYRVGSSVNEGEMASLQHVPIVTAPDIAYDDGYYAASVNTLTFPVYNQTIEDWTDFFGANFRYETVPEPATLLLMGLGLVGIGLRRCRVA